MYFTSQQRKALWFVVIVFAGAVAVQYIQFYFFPPPAVDFSEFEKEFYRKRDSLARFFAEASKESREQNVAPNRHQDSAGEDAPVNINTADATELEKLPRIGPKMAQRIISYRNRYGPFRHKEDLMKVKGIGKKTFEKLKDLITIQTNGN